MKEKTLLLDTNVIISGLFFKGSERNLLEFILIGRAKMIIPQMVLNECIELLSGKFSKHSQAAAASLLFKQLVDEARIVSELEYSREIKRSIDWIRDKNDAVVLAAAIYAKPDFLITGDKDFYFLKGPVEFKIMRAGDFLRTFKNL